MYFAFLKYFLFLDYSAFSPQIDIRLLKLGTDLLLSRRRHFCNFADFVSTCRRWRASPWWASTPSRHRIPLCHTHGLRGNVGVSVYKVSPHICGIDSFEDSSLQASWWCIQWEYAVTLFPVFAAKLQPSGQFLWGYLGMKSNECIDWVYLIAKRTYRCTLCSFVYVVISVFLPFPRSVLGKSAGGWY